MLCNPLIDPLCLIGTVLGTVTSGAASGVASGVAGGVLGGIARAVTDGIRWIVASTVTWWVQIPSPDLTGQPAVSHIQQWLLPVTAAVAVGGVIAAGLRMALTRRANPLLDVTGGLLAITAATVLGTAAAALLLKAGDAWSDWVLTVSTGGHFAQRMIAVLSLGSGAAPAVVLIFGVLAIVLALVQAVLMLFRQAALIILAAVLPLAAAGSVAPATRTWVRKVTAWMLALICYKPAAAAVYAAAFTMIGSGRGIRAALTGFVMLVLSVLALPVLMKFFTWTTGAIASGGGSGQFLGSAAMGVVAVGALRSPGTATAAQDQAAYMTARLGPGPADGPPPGGPAPARPPGGPSGPGPAAGGAPPPATAAPPASATTASSARTNSGPASATPPATAAAAQPMAAAGPASAASGATGAAAAGPAGAAAVAAAQAARRATQSAAGAMEPGDDQ